MTSASTASEQQAPAPEHGIADGIAAALDAGDPRQLLADRVEQLYRQLPIALAAPFLIAAIASVELWDQRARELVMMWWIPVVVVTLSKAALYWAYKRSRDTAANASQWLRWLGIAALASGVNWGVAGAVFFPAHTDEQQVFLAFLLAGMASAGIPVYAASWPIFALYSAAILLPFTYVLASFGNRLFAEIALLIPVFYLMNVAVAYRLNQVFQSGYRLRHAYGKLTEEHTSLNERLEQQLADLTDAHREVAASGRKLALFAERAPIAVFEMDENATVLEMNPAAENMFGYPAAELTGRSLIRMLIPGEGGLIDRPWWEAFVGSLQPASHVRTACLRRDGLEITCEFSLTPLVNDEGELLSVIAQCRDVTQELEAERMKKEFTSTLSHELRTPLTSIIGSLQLLNSGVMGDLDKDTAELTTVAERNAQRLLDMINDILDIEKIESGKFQLNPETLALDELVRESLVLNRAFGERFGVRFQALGEPIHVSVNVDRKRVLQVLTNLLSNGAKFSPEGGAVEVGMVKVDGRVRVEVHDRGPGIPEGFRSRIFGRFAQADSALTRKKGGTGLGLAICKRLIELMDGSIGFTDREGGGSTFYFELPVQQAEVLQTKAA
jgi:PAS domain S-box-containing protein